MRVLVTSDTHLRIGARLPDALLQLADRADHLIHAGDVITLDVLHSLEALAPVTAVHGNVCEPEVAARLPKRAQVTLDGVRFGIVHDAGTASERHDRLRRWFPDCDVLVYGHTHLPELERTQDEAVLVINPGSPVQRRRAPWHSACWLELDAGRVVEADLMRIDPQQR